MTSKSKLANLDSEARLDSSSTTRQLQTDYPLSTLERLETQRGYKDMLDNLPTAEQQALETYMESELQRLLQETSEYDDGVLPYPSEVSSIADSDATTDTWGTADMCEPIPSLSDPTIAAAFRDSSFSTTSSSSSTVIARTGPQSDAQLDFCDVACDVCVVMWYTSISRVSATTAENYSATTSAGIMLK